MTTAKRILVSEYTVRAMLAEWHARFHAMPEHERAARHVEINVATPQEFADATSAWVFQMLERHQERP